MNEDDAILILTDLLRSGADLSKYGYEVYIPHAIYAHLRNEKSNRAQHEIDNGIDELSPVFYAAAWDLCRRGILRPGVRRRNTQVTPDGCGGDGYSLTPLGRNWLREAPTEKYIPVGQGRFEQMVAPFQTLFGPGFVERAVQAIQCYRAAAFVACCAMAGAAAESIILAAAVAKTGDEDAVLKAYTGPTGRGRIEAILVGTAKEHIRTEFRGFMLLLKYWRDQASHGVATQITDNEAYTSLTLLLRFAHFMRDRWRELTQ